LLREDRALTSPFPGTTRDTIEETAAIGGIPFRFIDTAGLRSAADPVEQAGIERARRMVESASLILMVVDASAPPTEEDEEILRELSDRAVIGVLNKNDLATGAALDEAGRLFGEGRTVRLSALQGDGLEDLETAMVEAALGGALANEELMLTRERHRERVKAAVDSVNSGIEAMENRLSPELVSLEFSEALAALAGLLGKEFTEDLLDNIFSEFCIGK
jgi:tRNA modification GTPase